MALPANRKHVTQLLEILKPRIIGQVCDGQRAIDIIPGGNSYPGDEVLSSSWSVALDSGNSAGLSCLIDCSELESLFKKHFDSTKVPNNPYRLEVSGGMRVSFSLPVALSIWETKKQIRFCFDWGKDYEKGMEVLGSRKSFKSIPHASSRFSKMIKSMKTLEPMIYAGGPEPELPFEYQWLTDYHDALAIAEAAKEAFFQNLCGGSEIKAGCFYSYDLAFMKS